MAISGAFGAGFMQGFGQSMAKNQEKRFDQQQQYVDNMMENARRLAPKYAQDTATANATVDLMHEFESRYGVSNTEFIALAQNFDISEVYKNIQIAEKGLRPSQQLEVRKQILNALNIPEGTKLPDGMTAEQAVRNMIMGYAQNVNSDPNNNTEAHKNKSWAKAISDVLALNPRASAEEQISAMKIAGVPVQQILQYQAMQGSTYKPLAGVDRTGVLDFSDDYKATDFDVTANSFTSAFIRAIADTDDLGLLDANSLDEAMKLVGVDSKGALVETISVAGVQMAELELDLANVGINKVIRDSALRRLGSQVNTGSELKNLNLAVESGLALNLIKQSYEKHGKLTPEYINYILSNKSPSGAVADAVTKKAQSTPDIPEDPLTPQLGAGVVGEPELANRPTSPSIPEDREDTAASDTDTESSSLLSKIKQNQKSLDKSPITPESGFVSGNASVVAAQQDELKSKMREAASKITYSAYERMLETKAGRDRLEAMGLPTEKFRTGKDRAFAFGVMNPEQYFAPEQGKTSAKEKTKSEAPMTLSEFKDADGGMKLLSYLIDEEGITPNDSIEDIEQAVAAWFGANTSINVGVDVSAREVAKFMKQAISKVMQEK